MIGAPGTGCGAGRAAVAGGTANAANANTSARRFFMVTSSPHVLGRWRDLPSQGRGGFPATCRCRAVRPASPRRASYRTNNVSAVGGCCNCSAFPSPSTSHHPLTEGLLRSARRDGSSSHLTRQSLGALPIEPCASTSGVRLIRSSLARSSNPSTPESGISPS